MESLGVNEFKDTLDLLEVEKVMEESASYADLIINWKLLAQKLCLNDTKIDKLERKIYLGTFLCGDAPREILKLWKCEKGASATIQVLQEALIECGFENIAELLQTKFGQRQLEKAETVGMESTVASLNTFRGLSNKAGNEPFHHLKDEWSPKASLNLATLDINNLNFLVKGIVPSLILLIFVISYLIYVL